jgi:uncharacterized RDD family membrane protein YckC
LGGSGRLKRIFWGCVCLKSVQNQKNPFQSARSAQSVLPLYPKTTFRRVYHATPKSEIRNPQSTIVEIPSFRIQKNDYICVNLMLMNNCPKCQSANPQNARYCPNCGYDNAPRQAEKLTCPTCKQTYPPETRFCMIDGTRLTVPFQEAFKPADAPLPPVYAPLSDHRILDEPVPIYKQQVYPKASLGNRFLAMLLDSLVALGLSLPAIFCFVFGAAGMEHKKADQNGILMMGIGAFLILLPIGYMFIKDGLNRGQSYGKRAMDLMVVDLRTYQPCDKGKSAMRQVVSMCVGFIPLVGSFIEPIMVLATDDGRKLSDKAANTQVVDIRDFYE